MTNTNYNFTILRVLEIFPFLEKQVKFPRIKALISTILNSLIQIAFTWIVLLIFILIFAIIGKSAFSGVESKHCVPNSDLGYEVEFVKRACSKSFPCPENWNCVFNGYKHNEGYADFNNLLEAMLATLKIASMDNWSKLMNTMQDGSSKWFSAVFHISCILICGYFTMNLTLPVFREYYFICITKAENDQIRERAINQKLVL